MSIDRVTLPRTRAALPIVCGVTLALLAAGCGASSAGQAAGHGTGRVPAGLHQLFPGFALHYRGTARIRPARPPRSSALPGAYDLLAVRASVFAATGQGIFRSTDGGVSWRQVLSGISAASLASVPAGGYAALGTLPAANNNGPAVLATSRDGVHWRIRRVAVPAAFPLSLGLYRFALTGLGPTSAGIAVPNGLWTFGNAPALRTINGGRTWTVIRSAGSGSLPAGAMTGVALTPGAEYVTAPGHGASCAGAVYRSADTGATWSQLPGSCQPYPLMAVQFVSAADGFAAGGIPAKFGGGQVVEVTSDGGLTWRTTWRTPVQSGGAADDGVLRLDMLNTQRGWALTGGCVGGQNGPCGGTVYVTTDGGYRWYRTSQSATAVAGIGAAGAKAVSADGRSATSATTADGGRTWTQRTAPAWASTTAFAGTGPTLVWQDNLGDFLSADAGARWAVAGALEAPRFSDYSWLAGPPDRLLGFNPGTGLDTVASSDGGRSLTTSVVPDPSQSDMILAAALGTGGSAIAVTGQGADCLTATQVRKAQKLKPGWKPPSGASVLFASPNGGVSWDSSGTVLPFGVELSTAAAVDGSHVAVIDACNRLQVSADGGEHWQAHALGNGISCSVSALRSELWLTCLSGTSTFWLLHSANSGSTWTVFRLPSAVAANGLSGLGSAVATTFDLTGIAAVRRASAVIPAGGSIWRTSNGGASLAQSWPSPPA
jgi:hypothetical protein